MPFLAVFTHGSVIVSPEAAAEGVAATSSGLSRAAEEVAAAVAGPSRAADGVVVFWEPHPLSAVTAASRIPAGATRGESTLMPFFWSSGLLADAGRPRPNTASIVAVPDGQPGIVTQVRSTEQPDDGSVHARACGLGSEVMSSGDLGGQPEVKVTDQGGPRRLTA